LNDLVRSGKIVAHLPTLWWKSEFLTCNSSGTKAPLILLLLDARLKSFPFEGGLAPLADAKPGFPVGSVCGVSSRAAFAP
jgi:hypothetical protein